MGIVVRRWNLMEELAQRLQQLETQVGQQRAVIEHQQEQLMRQQTTIDAERAAVADSCTRAAFQTQVQTLKTVFCVVDGG